jgi:hypothetical protein
MGCDSKWFDVIEKIQDAMLALWSNFFGSTTRWQCWSAGVWPEGFEASHAC